jgi:hypothetical protein
MLVDFDRFFEKYLVDFEGDHLWGAANLAGHRSAGFIQPGKHGPAEKIIVDADIAGLAYFIGNKLHTLL